MVKIAEDTGLEAASGSRQRLFMHIRNSGHWRTLVSKGVRERNSVRPFMADGMDLTVG